jgi:membrane associated rhomboid family serine protease
MSGGGPDLFVICKNCSSEVSPYITECPYCGARLRKRAPKIERGTGEPKVPRVRRPPKPSLGRLKAGEIPGIRGDETKRPVVTIALVLLSAFGFMSLAFVARSDVALFVLDGDPWRYVTAAFVYGNGWYQFAALLAIGLFGWRLELRHGPVLVALLFAVCGVGGLAAATAAEEQFFVLGANGAALGLLAAWAVPILIARRRGDDDDDADLIGAGVIFLVNVLMPVAVPVASAVAGAAGMVAGILAGLVLARVNPR